MQQKLIDQENAPKQDVSAQFKKGILEMCILTLVKARDCYGYELVEEISKKVNVNEGTVYPILRRLTVEKYFETYLKESNEGPPRKYYRITQLGQEMQVEMISQWKEFNKNVNSLLNIDRY
jgi:PadR family transcriptional regulator PadR